MTWEEFKESNKPIFSDKEETDIECPKCGAHIYRDTRIVLTSYPAQYRYECPNC